jgi:uncharacterized protein (DUF1501 family)
MKKLNRREFLANSGVAAATAAFAHYPGAAFSQMIGTGASFPDYKALVCVFLFGGNDSYNMVVPRSNAEYNVYAASRQNLAIPQQDLLPINPLSGETVQFGLHPSMPGIQGLFETGSAAVINNAGPLVEPTTKGDYFAGSVSLPPQLFSHNDQQDQWHSLKGAMVSKTGWGGRIADLIRTNVAGQQLATNVSLFGSSLFQSADETVAYVMGNNGPLPFPGFDNPNPDPLIIEQRLAFERIAGADYSSIYERGFAEVQLRAVATADLVTNALDNAPVLNTVFPSSQLGVELETVARMIGARNELAMERQIFFVAAGGFDTHDDQSLNQPGLLDDVSVAMTAFYDAMVELSVSDSVTAFTQSDFGRTLTSNGDGSDHGWGGVQLVVGDAVAGQRMYGTYPDLALDGPDDVGGGRFIPTTSSDQYAATIARWFGIPDVDLDVVAPNLANFATRDLGFLI